MNWQSSLGVDPGLFGLLLTPHSTARTGHAILLVMNEDAQQTRILSQGELRISGIATGTVLRNRYRLDSEIGRGGMGIVYRATDLELMREVAVKVLPGTSSSSDARQRLIREARAAAALNHPHMDVLLAAGKRSEAAAKLEPYRQLVAGCQAPRFKREASRLAALLEGISAL